MKKLLIPILILFVTSARSQGGYLIPGENEWLLNRLEIKADSGTMRFSSIKPYNRRYLVAAVEAAEASAKNLSTVDRLNIEQFLAVNSEWSGHRASFLSRKPVLKHLYRSKVNALEVEQPGFHLVFNPMIQYQQYKEDNNSENVFLNSRGIQARGLIDRRIGFSFYFTENQERTPRYVNQWVDRFNAVPGVGYFKRFKNTNTAYDYFDTRASVSWKVASFVDMQLAYDRNFTGNGYRSLFLSDFSNNYTFLKVLWHSSRFRYQNIFAELFPFHLPTSDRVYPRKYFRAHYLDFAAAKWLNLGLFEGTMTGRDKLHAGLFNPVMYLHFPSRKNKIEERSYLGFDLKANFFKRLQLYGQLLVDKLNTSGLADKTWDNRFGYQAGLKYVDVFGVRNLDLQIETNRVRPYTYAADDSMTSYTHYNQPLAHPLGANFEEYILIIRAQPHQKWCLQAKLIAYVQGLDLVGYNMGSNPFGGFGNRLSDVRVRVGDGDRATCVMGSMLASFELRPNIFIDASYTRRNYETLIMKESNTSFMSIGFRWNMARREFDF
ncbi:MAG TPA: hypothetical protein VF145_14245 [Chitinophagaceae bacterium]